MTSPRALLGLAAGVLALLAGAQAGALPTAVQTPTRSASPIAVHKARSAASSSSAASAAPETRLREGRFGTVTVYIPDDTPKSVAIFLSGDGGWEPRVVKMARLLMNQGAVVLGVDIRHYLGALSAAARRTHYRRCQMVAADLESLSHRVQKEIGMEAYHVPVLVGYSSGATVVYAGLVQSPPGTFAGAMSLGFCPDQDFEGATLCTGAGLHYRHNRRKHQYDDLIFKPARTLRQPWIALQGQKDQVCDPATADAFVARTSGARIVHLPRVGHGFEVGSRWIPQFRSAYQSLVPPVVLPAMRPPDISDLPLNEVQAQGSSDEFALLLTGDGGWAGLDQELAARLAASSVPTVALNSLKYFWEERTPQQAANDVARILRHYLAAWHKDRVLLVGYSFGADVLPFIVKRLPPDLRSRVATLNLLGIDSNASFEITIAEWLGADRGPKTRPELETIGKLPVLCIYGQGESDTICPTLPGPRFTREEVGHGHHFSGEYAQLAERILAFARSPRPRV